MPQYTPTEQRILKVLEDGYPHLKSELVLLLNDDMATEGTIHVHICNLRRKMEPVGESIQCLLTNGQSKFRRVRLIPSPYDGKK